MATTITDISFEKKYNRVLQIIIEIGKATDAKEINKKARLPYFVLYCCLDKLALLRKISIDNNSFINIIALEQ